MTIATMPATAACRGIPITTPITTTTIHLRKRRLHEMQADQYVFIGAMYSAAHIEDDDNDDDDTVAPICKPEARCDDNICLLQHDDTVTTYIDDDDLQHIQVRCSQHSQCPFMSKDAIATVVPSCSIELRHNIYIIIVDTE